MADDVPIKVICDEHDTDMVRIPAWYGWECPVGNARLTDEEVAHLHLEALVEMPPVRVTGCKPTPGVDAHTGRG